MEAVQASTIQEDNTIQEESTLKDSSMQDSSIQDSALQDSYAAELADELVSIDEKGSMIVNKETDAPNKLLARRAIEAHLEVKALERSINEYDWDDLLEEE